MQLLINKTTAHQQYGRHPTSTKSTRKVSTVRETGAACLMYPIYPENPVRKREKLRNEAVLTS
jgi:hypothetical protein